jgi:hypothetical protein
LYGDKSAIAEFLQDHPSLDILVDDEFQEVEAVKRAEHDGHPFPEAEINVIVAPGKDVLQHRAETGNPTMWYWSSEAKNARRRAVVPKKSRIRRIRRR